MRGNIVGKGSDECLPRQQQIVTSSMIHVRPTHSSCTHLCVKAGGRCNLRILDHEIKAVRAESSRDDVVAERDELQRSYRHVETLFPDSFGREEDQRHIACDCSGESSTPPKMRHIGKGSKIGGNLRTHVAVISAPDPG